MIETISRLLPRLTELAKTVGGYKDLLLRIQRVSKLGMQGVMATQLLMAAYAGYQIVYNTEGQEPIEFDPGMLAELDEDEEIKQAA